MSAVSALTALLKDLPRRVKPWWLGAGLVAVITVLGLVVLAVGGDPAAGGLQSSRAEGASARGDPRSPETAKAAAANYLSAAGAPTSLRSPSARRARALDMSLTNARARVVKQLDDVATAPKTPARGGLARTAVLGEDVASFKDREATVCLWTATVRGSTRPGKTPHADFRTVTFFLGWEKGMWKVASVSSEDGPRPSASALQTADTGKDFAPYRAQGADDPRFSGRSSGDGLPASPPRGAKGARAAAVNAVTLQGSARFILDEGWRDKVLDSTTAPDVLASVRASASATADRIVANRRIGPDGRTGDGSVLLMRTGVLAHRILGRSARTASVELWTVHVGGTAGGDMLQVPQVSFRRMRVELARDEDNGWKAERIRTAGGLVPMVPERKPSAPSDEFAEWGGDSHAPALA
ncbi:hypothetical protein [Streptomyces sp. NPDC048172]|uniref:hypothetical protein n=1 Tax=Streptomyces sp. NPDC048172 TaxID=3365505 RepID=UPI0037107296